MAGKIWWCRRKCVSLRSLLHSVIFVHAHRHTTAKEKILKYYSYEKERFMACGR